jgi:hypothetical protein
MQNLFNSIISKGAKDNTYKFALMKFLLDFSQQELIGGVKSISYSMIAEKFLEYYWFQECKYKLKQDFKVKRMPMIIRIIRNYCGEEYIPQSYEKYFQNKKSLKQTMVSEIEKECLKDVIPRLQPRDNFSFYRHFHILNSTGRKYKLPSRETRYIEFTEEAHKYFKDHFNELSSLLIFEWAKFLEKTNFTPMLISKLEGLGLHKRKSLSKFRRILLSQMDSKCFYCNIEVDEKNIEIDHFIPWSYVYEDAIWNLVISCKGCNGKKSDCLASQECVSKIEDRNNKYGFNDYNKDIMEYYVNCLKAGFTSLNSIECAS